MATVTVTSPVPGYSGHVIGFEFTAGKATVDRTDVQALAYFKRHGYDVGDRATLPTPASLDPRQVGEGGDGAEVVGTRLRDAAANPEPADFLPPTNAGQANPHGPRVVSPGLHATPPAPLVPGPVSSDVKRQQEVETAAAEATLVDQQPVGEATAAAAAEQPPAVVDGAEDDRPSTQARKARASKKASSTG